jgi:FkbM family methyltransferase
MTGNSRVESRVEEGTRSFWRRIVQFIGKPRRHQYRSLATRLQSKLPSLPIPIYLPFGAWYLVEDSEVDYRILFDCFEVAETQFIQRHLQPGMTVLDIGAHHGYYSLMASRAIREQGSVHAFEPAPRERAHLKSNLALNRCKQVAVYEFALGATRGTATLFQAETKLDGWNSLRPQDGVSRSKRFEVQVFPLDQFLLDHQLQKIDFIKMDVEGAELSVLQGASKLLGAPYRPVILAEVSDLRTKAWGYRALEILRYLESKGFGWFEITPGGRLAKANIAADFLDRNMLAAPPEQMDGLRPLLDEQ